MRRKNIAEEIQRRKKIAEEVYLKNTNIDKFTCKQTFSSSERDFLIDTGFERTKLSDSLTIWHKTYMEDVDGYGAVLELVLNPYGEEPGSVSINVHADIMGNIDLVDEIDFSFSNCAGSLYRDLFSLGLMKLIWIEE